MAGSLRTGRYDDALCQCRIALQTNPADESAESCEERSLAESGQPDEAWRTLRRHAPAWLATPELERLAALVPKDAYLGAMRLAAIDMRMRLGAGHASACLDALAGDRSALSADLETAVAMADPGLRFAPVTPELVRLIGLAQARRLAVAVPMTPPSRDAG